MINLLKEYEEHKHDQFCFGEEHKEDEHVISKNNEMNKKNLKLFNLFYFKKNLNSEFYPTCFI